MVRYEIVIIGGGPDLLLLPHKTPDSSLTSVCLSFFLILTLLSRKRNMMSIIKGALHLATLLFLFSMLFYASFFFSSVRFFLQRNAITRLTTVIAPIPAHTTYRAVCHHGVTATTC